jgi:uncharacterized Fe-S cluster-containing radical SAM superfamily protein
MSNEIISQEFVGKRTYIIRGQKVMLDRDLAELYGVPTKRLNEQVRRNIRRFPKDFMFKLTKKETEILRSQIATLRHGEHSKYRTYVFTEQGVAMLSSVLASDRAIDVNIAIMRAFVKIRMIMSTHKELAEKLKELERKIEKHDSEIIAIFEAIRQLTIPLSIKEKGRIGFHET